jgi:hypothetical protein
MPAPHFFPLRPPTQSTTNARSAAPTCPGPTLPPPSLQRHNARRRKKPRDGSVGLADYTQHHHHSHHHLGHHLGHHAGAMAGMAGMGAGSAAAAAAEMAKLAASYAPQGAMPISPKEIQVGGVGGWVGWVSGSPWMGGMGVFCVLPARECTVRGWHLVARGLQASRAPANGAAGGAAPCCDPPSALCHLSACPPVSSSGRWCRLSDSLPACGPCPSPVSVPARRAGDAGGAPLCKHHPHALQPSGELAAAGAALSSVLGSSGPCLSRAAPSPCMGGAGLI